MNWLLQRDVVRTLLAHFYQHGERCYLFLHLWLRALVRAWPLAARGKKSDVAILIAKFEAAMKTLRAKDEEALAWEALARRPAESCSPGEASGSSSIKKQRTLSLLEESVDESAQQSSP